MFIDQLCIDQENVAERNHQVHQMGRIYKSAKQVVCWLGPETPTSCETVRKLIKWTTGLESQSQLDDTNHDPTPMTDPWGFDINPARQFFNLEYWSRAWVVQELVLAQDLLFRWGSETLTFDNVAGTAFFTGHELGRGLIDLCYARESHQRGEFADWLDILDILDGRHCEEPKDKVFAMLGLNVNSALKPDYSKTAEEIFDQLAKEVVQYKGRPVSESELRSWAYYLGLCGKHVWGFDVFDVSKYMAMYNEKLRKERSAALLRELCRKYPTLYSLDQ